MSSTECKTIAQIWQHMLSKWLQEAESVAQSVQRNRKLDVETIVQSLVLGCLTKPDASLNDFAQVAHELGVDVVASSIHDRLNVRMVLLLTILWEHALKHQVTLPTSIPPRLHAFAGVYLVDSTQLTVSSGLYTAFYGNEAPAKMKVHVALNYLSGDIQLLESVAGRQPDQKCPLWDRLIHPHALYLFDLGYFKQEILRDVDQASAFFVTRCQSQVALYDPLSGARIQLIEQLCRDDGEVFEAQVCLGSRTQLPVRILARRVDPRTAAERRRHAKKKAKDAGQTCTKTYLEWLDWDILITNLPSAWDAEAIFVLYGIRWQIELVFKVWKSQLGVAQLGNWRPERVMCQFYAHLIGVLLSHRTVAVLRWKPGTLISLSKSVRSIQSQVVDLLKIIARQWRGLMRWASNLYAILLRYAQHDRRKKTPTTMQFLMDWG